MARSSDLPFPFSLLQDRSFQAREVRRVAAIGMLYLGITTLLVGLFYSRVLDSLLDGVAPLLFVSEDMQLAADAVPALGEVLGRWLLVMLAINVLVTVAIGAFLTRRLGQPLLAIKRTLREIGRGNLDVRLRASDSSEFAELATELGAAVRTVRERVAAAKGGLARLDAVPGEDAEASAARLDALAECRAALDWFQVEAPASDRGEPDGGDLPHAGTDARAL